MNRHATGALLLISLTAFLMLPRALNAQSTGDGEVKRVYQQLIDAENRHDLTAVRNLVWKSPSTLFVAKAPVGWHGYWGADQVMQHLHDMYQQPFRIDPVYDEETVVFITHNIAETYAPVRITVAYGGQTPVPKPFIMVLLWIRTADGWRMTTDIPIPVPPDPTKH